MKSSTTTQAVQEEFEYTVFFNSKQIKLKAKSVHDAKEKGIVKLKVPPGLRRTVIAIPVGFTGK